jgi:protein TonB
MPTFPGGDEALYSFVGKQIVYPEIAKRAGVEGKLYIQFVVRTDGKVSDVTVQKGIGAGCDEEAVRVVRSMPNWKPGRQNGHPVNVRISIPIVFKLQG